MYLTSQEAQKFIPLIPKYFDEPFADSSQIPTYLISKMAVKEVKVALSGMVEMKCLWDTIGIWLPKI